MSQSEGAAAAAGKMSIADSTAASSREPMFFRIRKPPHFSGRNGIEPQPLQTASEGRLFSMDSMNSIIAETPGQRNRQKSPCHPENRFLC